MEGRADYANAAFGQAQGAGFAAQQIQQDRVLDSLIKRIDQATSMIYEAKNRLDQFASRLSGPIPEAIGNKEDQPKPPTPMSVEGRLMAHVDALERHGNDLHTLISRLERSA